MAAAKEEFDVGPLSWVKPEIELALQRADEGITRSSVNPNDQDIIRSTLTHLHQVTGALLMVGLEPVARVSEALEKLTEALGRGEVKMSAALAGTMRGALAALNQYLEGLMRGEANRPLMLFAAYRAVLTASGNDKATEVDLFYPDLSRRPKFSEGTATRAGAELVTLLNLRRGEFQRGLIGLLRGVDAPQSLRAMRAALSTIEAMQPAGTRMLWWVAVGFLEGMEHGATPPGVPEKQLCGRIDQQIKRQAEGADSVSERLMREVLYAIAKMPPVTDRLREIQQTYRLRALLSPSVQESPEDTRVRLLQREIKEQLEAVKETWLKFTAGNRASIDQFVEQTTHLNILAQGFGNPAFQVIFSKLAEVGASLKANPRDAGEALALETATTLLMAKDALDNYHQLGGNFRGLAETAVTRVGAALAGQPLPSEGAAQLADVSRAAQEKLLLFQLGKEILTNLNHIEQLLDAFFRDPGKRADLQAVPGFINQVHGALAMLESEDAVNLLKASRDLVQKFLNGSGPADGDDADLTAEAFSNLGLFVSALQQGREDPDQLLHRVLARFNIAPTRPVVEAEGEVEIAPHMLEQDLDAAKRAIAALFDQWQREPQAAAPRSALVDALSALRRDAQSAEEARLAEQAGHASALLSDAARPSAPPVRDAFVALLGSHLVIDREPAKPVGVVEPAAAEVDAELLEIFLEEATEVLGSIGEQRDVIVRNANDREALTVMRRGFHTLKGSGRMVGLTDLGEVAWQVEQVMNKWLRDEQSATKGLLRLISEAHQVFGVWVEALKHGVKPGVDSAGIFRLADQLKNDQEPTDEPAPVSVAAEPVVTEPVVTAPIVTAQEPLTITPTVEPAAKEEVATADEAMVPLMASAAELPSMELADITPIDFAATAADSKPAESIAEPVAEEPRKVTIGDISLDADFFEIFANEARTHRATLLDQLSTVRADAAHPFSHEFMRSAHTLTGISRASGITAIASLGFAVEQWLLDRLDHPAPLIKEDTALTIEAVETLADMVAQVIEQRAPHAEPLLAERVSERLRQIRAERREHEAKAAAAEIAVIQLEMSATRAPAAITASAVIPPLMDVAAAGVPVPPVVPEFVSEFPVVSEPTVVAVIAIPEVTATVAMAPAPTVTATVAPAMHPAAAPPSATFKPATTHVALTGKERRGLADDIDRQLLPIFLEEAFDLIPEVGDTLRLWRSQPSDKAPASLLGRHLHTLKGSARMAGVMRLGELTHQLENRVVDMQEAAQPTTDDFDALEDGFDRVTAALGRLKAGGRIEEEAAAATTTEPSATETAARSPLSTTARSPFRTAAKSPLSTAARRPLAAVVPPGEEVDRRAVLRVRADLVDRFVNDAGEISIARSRIEGEMVAFRTGLVELTDNVVKLRAQLREIEIQAESQIQSGTQHTQVGDTFDPLEFDRFTRMQELSRFMAESVNDFVTLQQSLTKNLDETDAALAAQSRLNRELQQDLMSVRMVPLGNLADRLYRVVRQTAKELGKKANLEFKGVRAELDRGVLEKIVAPFEHLLRNAIAHGIEIPEQREAAGKSVIGEITIDARQQANEVVLTISDDGSGIDLTRVREKALQSNLLTADEKPAEEQLLQYIFLPGFTTAKEITQVSGRGVGMDVVRNAIVTLGGRIEVATEQGKGTRFIITLPLTLAVTQAVLVKTAGSQFAIPSVMVEQVQEWKIAEITAIREKKEIVWQGNHYPFYALSHLLGKPEHVAEPRRYHPVLLLRSGVQRVAVEVDGIEGNREIVVKSIGPQLSRLTGIAGATVLGNGQVLLILNPAMLAARGAATPLLARVETTAAQKVRAPLIMVVDDSLTVRKITTRLLTREGYQVVTAKDGVDALQQLQVTQPDAMLLDIEMPRMDGFELTRNMRSDARTRNIPIIMITSRTAEKHRNFAFDLGVNEYLGKPFQEDELLGHIARYVVGQAVAA